MKKLFNVLIVLLFMSSSINARSTVIQKTSCGAKASFTALQITNEYEDANYWEVWFYAFNECIEQDFGL